MVEAAVAGNGRFEASNVEVARAGVSYTVDTVRALRQRHAALAVVVGGDSLAGFPTWREAGRSPGSPGSSCTAGPATACGSGTCRGGWPSA